MKDQNTPTSTLELRNNIRCVLGYCEVTEHKGCLYESSRNDSQEIDLILELISEAVNKAEKEAEYWRKRASKWKKEVEKLDGKLMNPRTVAGQHVRNKS